MYICIYLKLPADHDLLNETDVGARELQGSGIAADVPEGFHSV